MPENVKKEKRQEAIERLIEISANSTLGLIRQEITRADAHQRVDAEKKRRGLKGL